MAKGLIQLQFLDEEINVEPSHSEESILEMALRSEVPIFHSCDGNASCGTCAIRVVEGIENINPMNELEYEFFTERNVHGLTPEASDLDTSGDISKAGTERLACQCVISGSCKVRVKYK